MKNKSGLLYDIMAGLTLAALGIPEVMGYTRIIGTPVITGLYTLLFPVLIFAFVSSSKHLVIGADSATAAIVAAALISMATPNTPEYVVLTSMVALLAGVLLLLARLLNLGFIANFLSRTVLIGFLTGVGVQVATGQLHGMLGLDSLLTVDILSHVHWPTVYVTLAVLAVISLFSFFLPRWPGALFAVIGAITLSYILNLESFGIRVLGEVPSGLPQIRFPNLRWDQITDLISVSFSCVIVILAQSAATSRAYAMRFGEQLDENRDLLGLSLGNFAAGLSGTFVVNGSPTKTEIVVGAGGRSQRAQITAALTVLLVLLFLTGPLAVLPNTVLATIVFVIGLKLIDYKGLRDIFTHSRIEFWLAVLTAVTVIGVGVKQGILLAIILSLLNHVRHSYQPRRKTLPEVEPGLVMYWFGADLFYANINQFTSDIRQLAQSKEVKWLGVDAGAITGLDYSAGKELVQLSEELEKLNIQLVWMHLSITLPLKQKTFTNREACIAAFRAQK